MFKIENLSKSYQVPSGDLKVLENINLKVEKGEFVMIMGESGSGKTTFINCVSSLLKPTSGSVYLNDKELSSLENKDLESLRLYDVAYVFQENYMIEGLTILENIIVSRLQYDKNAKDKGLNLLKRLKIEHIQDKYPHQVSGGERQRAAIARALINNPKVLFADEPTASLNPKAAKLLMEELQMLNQEGYTILMVTHSVMAASYGTRLLVLANQNFKLDINLPKTDTHEFILENVAVYL